MLWVREMVDLLTHFKAVARLQGHRHNALVNQLVGLSHVLLMMIRLDLSILPWTSTVMKDIIGIRSLIDN